MPNSILSRMEEELCQLLALDRPGQHRLKTEEGEPRSGSLEVAQRGSYFNKTWLDCWLKDFYEKENYLVELSEDPTLIVRSRDDKRFEIEAIDLGRSFLINIRHISN